MRCCQPREAVYCDQAGFADAKPRRRRRPIAFLLNLVLGYLLLVIGGGTLINTGHPVAEEAGRLLHVVTFVEPTIRWADSKDLGTAAYGLRLISHGVPVHLWL